jgi:PAS domain S-box-containing protein
VPFFVLAISNPYELYEIKFAGRGVMAENSNRVTEIEQRTVKRGTDGRKKISEKKMRKTPVIILNNEDETLAFAESIIDTIREPFIALDQDLRVVKVSRSFYEFFKVTPEETMGKLIYDLGNRQWDIPKLRELLETILPQKTSFDNYEVEHDFATIGKRIMLLNARQIHRVLGKERLILLAVMDITERREIESGLEKTRKELEIIKQCADEASDFAESIINTIHEPLIVLDKNLRVVKASRSFYQFFKVKPDDTVGQLIYDLGNKQWNIPKLRELLENILPRKTSFDNYEVEHEFLTIGKRVMLLNARQVQRVLGKERIILLAIEDITERKKLENTSLLHMKQLQIFYYMGELVEREGITLTEIYRELVSILPKGVQYPVFTCAKILIEENEFRTNNFRDTDWRIFAAIKVNGTNIGRIEVCYLENKPENGEGLFSKDEQMMINAVAERLGRVIERKQLEIEKEKYTNELAEKNTELERFSYTVSHDLKSPLVTVKTFLGYLKHDIAAADALLIEKDMFYMNSAVDKMTRLLEDLLEMSRVGQISNQPVKVTFDELLEETLSVTAGLIAEKDVQIRLHKEPVSLFGDRTRLVEIWQNLVENAVKFRGVQPSPQIDIGVEHHGDGPVFFVRDNGIGIEPKYQTKLFNIFEKLNPKMEGTGMGLAITKRIVELYQGKIWVESTGLGQGSAFFFTLPGALKVNAKGV